MDITLKDVVVWLILGGIAGWMAGVVVTRSKHGLGPLTNLGVGLAGAVIGGLIFNLLNIDYGMSSITISLQDVVSAFFGALLFLAGIWFYRKWAGRRAHE